MSFSIDNAIKRIRAFRKEQGLAKFRLAVMAGVPEGCLRNMDKPEWNPTLDTLKAIDAIIPKDFDLTTKQHSKPKHSLLPATSAGP